jgi:hypothetical protein
MAVHLNNDSVVQRQPRVDREHGADHAGPTTGNAARIDSAHSGAAGSLQDAASVRHQAVQQAQARQQEVAALEASRPRADLRKELSNARQQLATSKAEAVKRMAAELTLARQTLSPSMAERYEQNLLNEYRSDPKVQALLQQARAEADALAGGRAAIERTLLDALNLFGGPMLAQAAPSSPPAPRSLSSSELERMADDVEKKFSAPEKGIALAKALEGLNDADRAKLVGLVLSRESGVGPHTLTAESVGWLRDQGLITQAQYAALAKSFVGAANAGLLAQNDGAAIDHFLQTNTYSNGESTDAAVEFINAAQGPQAQQFLRDYGRAVFSALAKGPGYVESNAAEAMLQLLSRTTDKKTIAEIYAGFDAQQRHNILESLSTSDAGFYGADGNKPATDGLAILIDAVGSQKGWAQAGTPVYVGGQTIYPSGPAYDDLAVEIAKFAETSDDGAFFDGIKPRDARAEALGVLFTNHSQAILDKLTDHALSSGDGGAVEDQVDKIQLANLLRLTALNPDNSHGAAAAGAVNRYLDQWTATANRAGASQQTKQEAEARLEALVRAEVLVPAQIYADGIESKQTNVTLYKFAVDGVAKLLNYGAGKLPPGADKLAKLAIKHSVGAAKEAIEKAPWKGLDPFIKSLAAELDKFKAANGSLANFGILDDVQLEISAIIQRLKDGDYKQILHSKDVPQ